MTAAIVAAIMSVIELVEMYWEFKTGIDAQWVQVTLVALTPVAVWLVPGLFDGRD